MTDSAKGRQETATERRPGKRQRLVAAACQLLYEQGVEKTTIADIAQAADVPVGNVYYYFKTKDEIVGAVIDRHEHDIKEQIAAVERRHRTPKTRLKALVGALADQRELITRYGCPHGTLCSELDKRATRPGDGAAAELLRIPIDWAEQQFRSMGRNDARDLAVTLIAAYQGTALLTSTLRDPDVLVRESRRLERWIDSLETSLAAADLDGSPRPRVRRAAGQDSKAKSASAIGNRPLGAASNRGLATTGERDGYLTLEAGELPMTIDELIELAGEAREELGGDA